MFDHFEKFVFKGVAQRELLQDPNLNVSNQTFHIVTYQVNVLYKAEVDVYVILCKWCFSKAPVNPLHLSSQFNFND